MQSGLHSQSIIQHGKSQIPGKWENKSVGLVVSTVSIPRKRLCDHVRMKVECILPIWFNICPCPWMVLPVPVSEAKACSVRLRQSLAFHHRPYQCTSQHPSTKKQLSLIGAIYLCESIWTAAADHYSTKRSLINQERPNELLKERKGCTNRNMSHNRAKNVSCWTWPFLGFSHTSFWTQLVGWQTLVIAEFAWVCMSLW